MRCARGVYETFVLNNHVLMLFARVIALRSVLIEPLEKTLKRADIVLVFKSLNHRVMQSQVNEDINFKWEFKSMWIGPKTKPETGRTFMCISISTETRCEEILLSVRKRVECHGWQLVENTEVSGVLHCVSWLPLCLGNPAHGQQPALKCTHAPKSFNTPL